MEYKLGCKTLSLIFFLLFQSPAKGEDKYQENALISDSWVKVCEAKKVKLSEENGLFVGFDSPATFEGQSMDLFKVNVGDDSIGVPRYFSSIQLDEDTANGVLVSAVYQDKELLTYERIKMGARGCELACGDGLLDGYVYTESLTNAALRFTPNDIKCHPDSKNSDEQLIGLMDYKRLSLHKSDSTYYYKLPAYVDGRLEVRDIGSKVRVYIEYFDGGYRTVIVYVAKGRQAQNYDYSHVLMNRYLTDGLKK